MINLSLFLLWCLILRAQAGYYYCSNGVITSQKINNQSGLVDYLVIPWEEGKPHSEEGFTCKWLFIADFREDRILLLNGFDTGKVDLTQKRMIRSVDHADLRSARIWYRLMDASYCSRDEARGSDSVEFGTLRVLQLSRRAKLSVEFDQNWSKTPHNTPGLRIRLMEPGFCSRESVSFNHSCYTTSSVSRSLKEELTAMCRESGGIERLASFDSSGSLKRFVAQSQRTRVGSGLDTRSKIPLSLTQPVRIGLFYDRSQSSIYYLTNANDELQMRLFSDSHLLYYNVKSGSQRVSCGSLIVAQIPTGVLEIVDFGDCSDSLPALLSFPDSARNCCCNCSDQSVLSWLDSTKSAWTPATASAVTPEATPGAIQLKESNSTTTGPIGASNPSHTIYYVMAAEFALQLITIFVFAVIAWRIAQSRPGRPTETAEMKPLTTAASETDTGKVPPSEQGGRDTYMYESVSGVYACSSAVYHADSGEESRYA